MGTHWSMRHIAALSALILATAVLDGASAHPSIGPQAPLTSSPAATGSSALTAPAQPSSSAPTQAVMTAASTSPQSSAPRPASGAPASTASASASPTPGAATPRQDLAAAVADATNAQRVAAGLKPLTYRSCTTPAVWAVHLASVGSLTHNSLTTVLSACAGTTVAGENIAVAYGSVADVTAGWMASPGDKANIVNPTYTGVSVGVAQAADGTYYWVEDFTG